MRCSYTWAARAWLVIAPALLCAVPAQAQNASTMPDASIRPDATATARIVQPLPFSHKSHLTFKLSCTFCHANPDPGNQMLLPAATSCMGCHARVAVDKPDIQQLAKFAMTKEPIPWKLVYSVPGFVYWSHRTHLEGGVTCEMCHGDVAQMEEITKVKNVTTMAGCVACHRQKEAPTGCETCHQSQSSLLRGAGARWSAGQ